VLLSAATPAARLHDLDGLAILVDDAGGRGGDEGRPVDIGRDDGDRTPHRADAAGALGLGGGGHAQGDEGCEDVLHFDDPLELPPPGCVGVTAGTLRLEGRDGGGVKPPAG
jgi:hypothetical protein